VSIVSYTSEDEDLLIGVAIGGDSHAVVAELAELQRFRNVLDLHPGLLVKQEKM
jgi:hypothetical protein